MRKNTRTLFCVVVALVLVAGGLLWGARKGWQGEKATLQTLYDAESGLQSVLELRAADASNLLVVAGRHLDAQNAVMKQVASARDVLQDARSSLHAKYEANLALTDAVKKLSGEMAGSASFKADTRDQNYLTSLALALQSYNESGAIAAYNQAAQEFNQRIEQSPSGWAAGLMGVAKAQMFQ